MVAISAFGGLSVHIMTSSRMLFVGARNGHFPTFLAHLDVKHLTPLPSLVFLVSYINIHTFEIQCDDRLCISATRFVSEDLFMFIIV